MHNIGSGIAREHGSGIWRIVGAGEQLLTKFNQALFPHIRADAAVYFVDLDLDPEFCENVQAQIDADRRAAAATPTNGFQPGTEMRLRSYVMDALLEALRRTGQDRSTYLASLDSKMEEVRHNAEALPSRKVTVALLKKLGISG